MKKFLYHLRPDRLVGLALVSPILITLIVQMTLGKFLEFLEVAVPVVAIVLGFVFWIGGPIYLTTIVIDKISIFM